MIKLSKLVNAALLSFALIYPVHSYAKALTSSEIGNYIKLINRAIEQGDVRKAAKYWEIVATSEITQENREVVVASQKGLGVYYLKYDKKMAERGKFLLGKACKNGNEEACNLLK